MPYMNIQPTAVTNLNRIDFLGNDSPKHVQVNSVSSFDNVELKLWIWSGELSTPWDSNSLPTITLNKSKVSVLDDYVLFEIGDYVKGYIDPSVVFDNSSILTQNEGVYYQYQTSIKSGTYSVGTQSTPTRYATLGYNWNYEGESSFTYNNGAFGMASSDIPKYYSRFIKYTSSEIDITGVTNSNMMVKRETIAPENKYLICNKEQYLIIYLNKQGLWDTFTPTGKVTISNKIESDNYNRAFRNPLTYNNRVDHQSIRSNITSKQSYVINTGALDYEMGEYIEEILYSPKVYLVQFKGDIIIPSIIGDITADNTLITVDNTLITIDGSIMSGLYKTYIQIPVVINDSDFIRKTNYNDKGKINYNIKFDQASNKINNIR